MVSYTPDEISMRVGGLVLILIVVDNGLVRYFSTWYTRDFKRLNPYCSGQWSRTNSVNLISELPSVLILIVVDNGLVQTSLLMVWKVQERS